MEKSTWNHPGDLGLIMRRVGCGLRLKRNVDGFGGDGGIMG